MKTGLLPKPLQRVKWWWRSVRGLRTHVQLFQHMHQVMRDHFRDEPFSEAAMRQLDQQKAMVGHCTLKVLLVFPPEPDGFDPDDWDDD